MRIKAKVRQAEAKQSINDLLQSEGIEVSAVDLIYKIKQTAVVTVNFHPDRLSSDGRAVVTALFEDGIYKSQFETGISNGGLIFRKDKLFFEIKITEICVISAFYVIL